MNSEITLKATIRTLEKLGCRWTGSAFSSNEALNAFFDQQELAVVIAYIAVAEHDFLDDLNIEFEIPDEETDKRIDEMLATARAVCKILH